jgi:hypothetical protein
VPIALSTYSEYLRWFGDVFSSGSGATEQEYKYLTSYTVQEYLKYGEVVTVVRVLAGPYAPAYSNIIRSSSYQLQVAGSGSYTTSDMAFTLEALSDGDITNSGQNLADCSCFLLPAHKRPLQTH